MENTSTVVYISATKSSKELELVSNDCYDNALYSCNKIYKQAGYLKALILKKELQILEKNNR